MILLIVIIPGENPTPKATPLLFERFRDLKIRSRLFDEQKLKSTGSFETERPATGFVTKSTKRNQLFAVTDPSSDEEDSMRDDLNVQFQ